MDQIYKVGIIGAGVSGSLTALRLADLGIEHVLFEQNESVVSGPPFCHLHAGGNLYPDISDEQCRILMKQSIEMARLFPHSIDKRPTFISVPKTEDYKVETILNRLKMLVIYYKDLIKEDSANAILGKPENYYKTYVEKDIENLLDKPSISHPKTADQWMINTLKLIEYDQLKMPLILVQEYGWNLFRLAAQAQLLLKKTDNCHFKLNTEVSDVKDVKGQGLAYNWEVFAGGKSYKVQYLVNACGYKTGKIDKCLQVQSGRLIEFKSAYISKWKTISGSIPELIFHGKRCTPHGMAQLTPYYDNYYQIHGMTEDITLFKDGLVKADNQNQQPEFNQDINQILTGGWEKDVVQLRTENAIQFVSKFVPEFKSAAVGGPPMYGAQQIPGSDANLRVGEVSFPTSSYARSEIVKASSALTVANKIVDNIKEENQFPFSKKSSDLISFINTISKAEVDAEALRLAEQRAYPKSLSYLFVDSKGCNS